MKATIWFVVGLVLTALSLLSVTCGVIANSAATATFNAFGVLGFIAALVCWHIGNYKN